MEYPFLLGTAGHIDHGKTALVKAMTGVDCDRLDEEKRRGITIELGFAPLRLPGGKTVSIVDVPGHERFIRQMAAGASGMDAALLVIAASEGVMPQTREHLDILGLLGVRAGLVALTKKDLVDGETLELARAEAAELIKGSCLDGAAILPVSALSGEGVLAITGEIENILEKLPPRKGFGAFFMPVDRVFSKKGFGCVVTGTSYQGVVAEGDEVTVMSAGFPARVRSLQTHGAKTGSVPAGQRAAINLSAVSRDQLARGDAVCAKDAFAATNCLGAWLDILPSAPAGVTHWQRVRLHVGTVDAVARVSLLRLNAEERRGGYPPGGGGPVQLLCESDITVAAGQRFVIRLYSPLLTVGGGRILLPNARLARGKTERAAKAALLENLAANFGPAAFLAALVHDQGGLSAAALAGLSQMDKNTFEDTLNAVARAPREFGLLAFGKTRGFITAELFEAAAGAARRFLEGFHARYPERAGLDAEKMSAALEGGHGAAARISGADFKELLGVMAARGAFEPFSERGKTWYRLPGFRPALDERLGVLVERVRGALAAAGFNLVTQAELEARLSVPPAELKRAAAYLRERGELWSIEGELLLGLGARDKLLGVLESMGEEISAGALRDSLGVNRKHAVGMLEFLDARGFTRREGDKRILLKNGGGV